MTRFYLKLPGEWNLSIRGFIKLVGGHLLVFTVDSGLLERWLKTKERETRIFSYFLLQFFTMALSRKDIRLYSCGSLFDIPLAKEDVLVRDFQFSRIDCLLSSALSRVRPSTSFHASTSCSDGTLTRILYRNPRNSIITAISRLCVSRWNSILAARATIPSHHTVWLYLLWHAFQLDAQCDHLSFALSEIKFFQCFARSIPFAFHSQPLDCDNMTLSLFIGAHTTYNPSKMFQIQIHPQNPP